MESTLSVQLSDLQQRAGFELGYGRGSAVGDQAWDSRQQAAIDFCVQSGQRQFYTPALDGGDTYDWSFLRPTSYMLLASGTNTVALPDEFGGIEGQITVSSSSSSVFFPVAVVGEGLVRARHAAFDPITGRPEIAAAVPLKGSGPQQGQRFQLYFFPNADADYTLGVQYYIHPNALSGLVAYPLGGMQHAETLVAAVLSAVEFHLDGMRGPRWEYFQERLRASISHDRRYKAQILGYNGSPEGVFNRSETQLERNELSVVTFNGQTP